ncbi:MAG: redoxin domain-containing protein [Chitinophagaceae bacterium]
MKLSITSLCVLLATGLFAQEPLLTQGDNFPDVVIKNISNSPVPSIDLNQARDGKYYILNFWGTWCSPCLAEMDSLAKLQKQYKDNIQVIGISDDSEERKQNYLKKKPSTLWLATDTNYLLHQMAQFSSVGQSIIVSPERKIVALVMSDSINQKMIDKLLKKETIPSSAEIKKAANTSKDIFGLDSTLAFSFSVRSYMAGRLSGEQHYLKGAFGGRRFSFFNASIPRMYRTAYNIVSLTQEIYDSSVVEKELSDYQNKKTLYNVDLLVEASQKDSLMSILQQQLNTYFPIKARQEKRLLDVYVLKKIDGYSFNQPASTGKDSLTLISFSGRGFDGTKVTVEQFAQQYLTNELSYPVVDETGIKGFYNISTNVELRNKEGILNSLKAIGLTVEKAKREMPVIVYYKITHHNDN